MTILTLLQIHECNDRESLLEIAEQFGVQNMDHLDSTLSFGELKRSLQNLIPAPMMEYI